MIRFLSAIRFFLVSFLAYAIEDEGAAPAVRPLRRVQRPPIVFAVLFFGMIIGFFWFMWKKEKERKERETQTSNNKRSRIKRPAVFSRPFSFSARGGAPQPRIV